MTEATDKEKKQLEVIGVPERLLHTAAMNLAFKNTLMYFFQQKLLYHTT